MDFSKIVLDAVKLLCAGPKVPTKDAVSRVLQRAFDAGWDAALDEASKLTGVKSTKIIDVGGVNIAQQTTDAILSLKKRHS